MRTGVDLRKIKASSAAPLTHEKLLSLLQYGENPNEQAIALANLLPHAFWIQSRLRKGEMTEHQREMVAKAKEIHCDRVFDLWERKLKEALRTRSGAFYRDFADAIERKPHNKAQFFVGVQLGAAKAFRQPIPSHSEMLDWLNSAGITSNLTSIARYYSDFETTAPKGKRGAPKGKRTVRTKSHI
jgi:hypothetical protein